MTDIKTEKIIRCLENQVSHAIVSPETVENVRKYYYYLGEDYYSTSNVNNTML